MYSRFAQWPGTVFTAKIIGGRREEKYTGHTQIHTHTHTSTNACKHIKMQTIVLTHTHTHTHTYWALTAYCNHTHMNKEPLAQQGVLISFLLMDLYSISTMNEETKISNQVSVSPYEGLCIFCPL